ncbi:MAG: TolC family protein [Proteobacteria bacterium]|nr:TolC family protein [Pseudomonadota bacterium]
MGTKRWFLRGVLVTLIAATVTAVHAAETVKPLSLSESIDLALKRSVLIHAAREGVKGAEAQRKEAFTGFLPKFSTSYSYTRLNDDPTVTSPGGSFTFPGPSPIPVTIPPSTYQAGTKENYNWNVEVRQPLFAGGGILASYDASRLGSEIARLEETATVQDLVQEVKIAYFNILKAGRIHAVARQSIERLTAHRDTAQGYYDVGIIPRNDLLYAEVELANGRQFLVRAENSLEMAKSKFNTLLRREINAPVEIEDALSDRPFTKPLDGCIAAAMENRPEIRSYTFRLEQAKNQVKLARSEYYPNVGLVGNYARYGDTPGVAGSPYRDQENWYVMAVANWNFWEWGKTKSRVEAGLSRENQTADILTNIREQIALEVKNAWILLHEAGTQIHVAKKATEQAEENFRINTERYREQVGTSTDVIDAQTLLTKAKADHDNALGDYSIGRAKLERAMGVAAPDGVE